MSKVKIVRPGWASFYCPGCKEDHSVFYDRPEHPVWSFNKDVNKPTFSPSIRVRSGHYAPHANSDDCWCNFEERYPDEGPAPFKCMQCHSYVRDGMIQFLGDCSHELAGQTVELPEVDGT